MASLNTFCLVALVFLSLPLPLFASAGLRAFPSARRSLVLSVWVNSIVLCAAGLLTLTPLPVWLAAAVGGTSFILCGMHMFVELARAAAVNAESA